MNIMTKRRQGHSPDQIVRRIQYADRALAERGDVVAGLRDINLTEATYYRWRKHSGGLKAEDAKKVKPLEKRHLPLKKLLAEAELEKALLKELAEGNC